MRENQRNSSIELFRILVMLAIISHHYIVNSGILHYITPTNVFFLNSIFALLYGFGGKIGINCFILITGYYMCTNNISVKKFIKLLLQIQFYKITIYVLFVLFGYEKYSLISFVKVCLPFYSSSYGFSQSFLIFYLFIPYINSLVRAMKQHEHKQLILLTLTVSSLIQSFLNASDIFNYIGWFFVVYIIGAYIRLYDNILFFKFIKIDFKNKRKSLVLSLLFIFFCMLSVLFGALVYKVTSKPIYYFFVMDSNKFLSISTAVFLFLYFINIKIRYNIFVNKVASSTFGVLLIHANSDKMREWLWNDFLQNIKFFNSSFFILHAILSVIIVYIVCTIIDIIRQMLWKKISITIRCLDLKIHTFSGNKRI